MRKYINSDCIYHHGIHGQRWGIRRWQNADGSWTPAGRLKYGVNVDEARKKLEKAKSEHKQALNNYNRNTGYGLIYDKKETDNIETSGRKLRWAKEDFQDEKIKEKLNTETRISKHRVKLTEQYKSRGMTEEEAAVAAYKREKTEKILAVTAGVTVTALAAYGAYKYHDYAFDKIIPKGTLIQNISTNSNKGVADAFYASLTEQDNMKYRGIYGFQLSRDKLTNAPFANAVYESKFKVNSGLKVASNKNATGILSDLVKNDPSYASTLKQHLKDYKDVMDKDFLQNPKNAGTTREQRNTVRNGLKALEKGKINSDVFSAFNYTLSSHDATSQKLSAEFYNKLKNAGYDAISDINDKKLSGYRSSNPLIVFNGASALTSSSSRQVLPREIRENYKTAITDICKRDRIETGAKAVAVVIGVGGISTGIANVHKTKTNDKIVREYRRKHPNTEMSYKEIVRNYTGRYG